MPIDSKHPDYIDNEDEWTKCSDFQTGSKAVKHRQKLYLPRPEGMDNSEYRAYLQRASFFNGMGRTVTGLVGAMTRVDAQHDLPGLIDHLIEDATGTGKTLQELVKQILSRIVTTGRMGILVDKPVVDDRNPKDSPVVIIPYNERAIVNWRETHSALSMLVLQEFVLHIDPEDPYTAKEVPQYRELELDKDGYYRARIWSVANLSTKSNSTTNLKFVAGPWIYPRASTGRLKFIPFVFCSPVGTEASVVKAPLIDLCDVNLSHYMLSADLEHGRHLVSLPTPWATGVDPEEYKKGLKIGSGTAWLITDASAQVGMLEFTGKGLGHLAQAIEEKQLQMAVLGAKLLQPQRKQVESAELARMSNAGDESILVGIAKSVGIGIRTALEFAAIWEGATKEATKLVMNTDFIDAKLAPDEILALNELYLNDVITLEELLLQLKTGERLQGKPEEVLAAALLQAEKRREQATALAQVTSNTGGNEDVGRRREEVAAE